MEYFDRKFQQDEIKVDGNLGTVSVQSRISQHIESATGGVEIIVRTTNGGSMTSIALSPDQMRDLAKNLMSHATRLELLRAEAAELFSRGAA
jgi:hypothetical protein